MKSGQLSQRRRVLFLLTIGFFFVTVLSEETHFAQGASETITSDEHVWESNYSVESGDTLNIGGTAGVTVKDNIDNSGTLRISDDARLTVVSLGNNGSLVINNSDNRISVSRIVNGEWSGGTITLTNSNLVTGGLGNYGVVKLSNSQIRISDETSFFDNYGDFTLGGNSSLIVENGVAGSFGVDSRFLIAGTGNAIKADELLGIGEWWEDYDPVTDTSTDGYGPNTVFHVEGGSSRTDFVDIDAKISFTSGALWNDNTNGYDYTLTKGTLEFHDVEANLSSKSYKNVKESGFFDAIVSGSGSRDVDFFFYGKDSGIKPGKAVGNFYGNNLTFNGSTLYIEVGSDDWDKIIASGDIVFSGGTDVVLINLGYTPDSTSLSFNDIFQAGNEILIGGVELDSALLVDDASHTNRISIADDGGKSNSVTIQSAVDIDGNEHFEFSNVWQDTTGNIIFSATGNGSVKTGTGNYQELRQVYNTMVVNGGNTLTACVHDYADGNYDRFIEAMDELDPVGLSLSEIFVQNAVVMFNRTNYDRLRALQEIGLASGALYRGQGCHPSGAVYGRSCGRDIWFQGLANWASQSKTNINGYTADTYGFSLGIDNRVDLWTILGVGFGGMFTRAKMREGLGDAKSDSFLFSLYGSHTIDCLTVNGTVGNAFSNLESNRYAPRLDGFANGTRDANTFFAGVELAYRFGNRNGYLTPFLSYDYVSYSEKAFQETGRFITMNVDKKNIAGHLQTLGVRFGRDLWTSFGGILTPELTAAWVHDYGVGAVRSGGSFVADNTVPFVVNGVSRNKNRALIGIKTDMTVLLSTKVFLRYDGEWAKNYNTQYLSAGLDFVF